MRVLLVLLTVTALGARTRTAPQPRVPVPTSFRNAGVADSSSLPSSAWWRAFGDPLLDELMDRASNGNLDLRRAASRLAEVQALRGSTKSALLPTLESSTSVNRLRGGFNQGVARVTNQQGASFVSPFETGILSSGFNLRWEADIFGGLRNELKAATADARGAMEAQRDVLLVVRAELARNYVEMRGFEEQIASVTQDAESQKQLLDLIRVRADAGLASEFDVERQATQLAITQSLLPDLDTQRLAAVHRIGVLLGEDPGAVRDRLEARQEARLQSPALPAAIPGELLKRRPDLRKAEADISAAFARTGAARSDLYPKFVITGLSGRQSTDASGLTLGAGNFFSVGPGITLPIFNAGRIRSKIAASDAVLEQSLRTYEQEVLAAYEETENAYVARDRAGKKLQSLESAQAAAKRAVEYAQELYTRGLGDFLAVLDAQRQQLQIERDIAASRTAVFRGAIALFKAIGEY